MLLRDMYDAILPITDERIWGEYAFSRDILANRIGRQEQQDMIWQAVRCGKELAEQLLTGFPTPCRPSGARCQSVKGIVPALSQIVEYYKIKLTIEPESIIGDRILFARFTPPDEIVIMGEPLKKYEAVLMEEHLEGVLPSVSQVYALLLGHELFHVLEEQYEDTIYTRNKKVTLWKLWKYENKSTVRAVGEIAAMYFSQTLNKTAFSPFILDVLLSRQYSEDIAGGILEDIMKLVK